MNYLLMYDEKDFIFAHDLDGRDVTVTIEKVERGELVGEKGRKSKKPTIKIAGRPKKFAVNKTNGKIIASMYGKDTTEWVGKLITLFPTTTVMDGETKDCIRVRPTIPTPSKKTEKGAPDVAT